MKGFPAASQAVYDAAVQGDFAHVKELVATGAELNVTGRFGDTLLQEIVSSLLIESPAPFRVAMTRLLIELGADPNYLGEDRHSALVPAGLAMDMDLLQLLLEAGADPNGVGGFGEEEIFYDWAEFDYRYMTWMVNNPEVDSIYPPEEPSETDKASEDAWLTWLDRMAIKYGVRRPDHLFLLRRYGAKTAQELGQA
ncbi:ankyrin repeat domain-containing protein [Phytopseudomonas daroniae]|uniref:ankyrin repeat domain-containing protein n=1 Tax=Phytopseudomonas daroniae TaxID=2487519 RepID=UPI0010385D30|nr:ankyrin repeat domain-containing protein [Pseudomonas daroniae]TBU78882.1 hypothetical protein DNK10_03875 [Pseudomonas daroniae]